MAYMISDFAAPPQRIAQALRMRIPALTPVQARDAIAVMCGFTNWAAYAAALATPPADSIWLEGLPWQDDRVATFEARLIGSLRKRKSLKDADIDATAKAFVNEVLQACAQRPLSLHAKMQAVENNSAPLQD